MSLFKKVKAYFLEQIKFTAKPKGRYKNFPYTLAPCVVSSIIKIPQHDTIDNQH